MTQRTVCGRPRVDAVRTSRRHRVSPLMVEEREPDLGEGEGMDRVKGRLFKSMYSGGGGENPCACTMDCIDAARGVSSAHLSTLVPTRYRFSSNNTRRIRFALPSRDDSRLIRLRFRLLSGPICTVSCTVLCPIDMIRTDPQAKDAHVGAVKQFTPPAVPSAPASLASTLASDLQTYDSTPVALAEASDVAAASTEGGAELDTEKMNVDELFEHLRQDVVVPVYHEDAHH